MPAWPAQHNRSSAPWRAAASERSGAGVGTRQHVGAGGHVGLGASDLAGLPHVQLFALERGRRRGVAGAGVLLIIRCGESAFMRRAP